MFSIVLYFDQDLSKASIKKSKTWTQQLITKAQILGGNYYLPYQAFATQNQFTNGYPRYKEFKTIKEKYDPKNRFLNQFYIDYMK